MTLPAPSFAAEAAEPETLPRIVDEKDFVPEIVCVVSVVTSFSGSLPKKRDSPVKSRKLHLMC